MLRISRNNKNEFIYNFLLFIDSNMTSKISIQDYTDKSFVVRGDTTAYKDTLKDMGGKWNSRLTDKDTGDKFGAWLFWTEKRGDIEKWLKSGCSTNEKKQEDIYRQSLFRNETASVSFRDFQKLEQKIDNLTKMVETLLKTQNTPDQEEIIEDDDDEETKTPPRRLLGQKKK